MVQPHPEYLSKKKVIDMTDLDNDQIVQFQKRFYIPLVMIVWLFMPTFVPWYFWNENLVVAFSFNLFRYTLSLHQTSLVNSAAHLFGKKIYDKRLMPTKHYFTTCVTMGEAYHNYHHAFPWDYSASEFGWDINYNPMTAVIDFAASLGMAWNCKKASTKLVEERIRKYGDIDRIEMASRKPFNIIIDTLNGILFLFWALWIILALKFVHNYYSLNWSIPIVESIVQFFNEHNTIYSMWNTMCYHVQSRF